jgi:hypothetical protein
MTSYAERAETYKITTVQFHRVGDKRIIDWLEAQRDMSDSVRRAITFYLDHVEQRPEAGHPARVDPAAIRELLDESLAAHLRSSTCFPTLTPL